MMSYMQRTWCLLKMSMIIFSFCYLRQEVCEQTQDISLYLLFFFKEERKEHAKTRTELSEVTDRLEFALGEVEILTKQLAREKEAFQRA